MACSTASPMVSVVSFRVRVDNNDEDRNRVNDDNDNEW